MKRFARSTNTAHTADTTVSAFAAMPMFSAFNTVSMLIMDTVCAVSIFISLLAVRLHVLSVIRILLPSLLIPEKQLSIG